MPRQMECALLPTSTGFQSSSLADEWRGSSNETLFGELLSVIVALVLLGTRDASDINELNDDEDLSRGQRYGYAN